MPGIDVNAKDKDDETALMLASKWGYLDIVRLSLNVPGIDVQTKKNPGKRHSHWRGNLHTVTLDTVTLSPACSWKLYDAETAFERER